MSDVELASFPCSYSTAENLATRANVTAGDVVLVIRDCIKISKMCEHSQRVAVSLGFRAMQYNLVFSTNEGAIHLWKKHGFRVIGILPRAFKSMSAGYVDALVMYKELKT